VSLPAVIEPEGPGGYVASASASRLIPGVSAARGSALRRKPQSASVDGRYWAGEEQEKLRSRRKRDALQALAEAVLPAPLLDQGWQLAGSVLADFALLGLSFAAIAHLKVLVDFALHRNAAVLLRPGPFLVGDPGLVLLYGALIALLGYSEGLYRPELLQAPLKEWVILGKAVGWATMLLGLVGWLSGMEVSSTTALVMSAPFNYLGMKVWREWKRRRALRGRAARNVLIVGAGKLGREVAAYLKQNQACSRTVCGFLDEDAPLGGEVRGRLEDLTRIARAEFVDEIILAIPSQRELSRQAIWEARRNRLDVKMVPDLLGFELQSPALESFGRIPILTLNEEPTPVLRLFLKRVVDVVGSVAALAAALPVMFAIALVVKLDSCGPLFYRALRVGKKGRKFTCYKFRTMEANAEELKKHLRMCNERQGPFFKITDDPRITRAGRFLRRYSLDELPQLWNVLKGEMSLVGPRPHPLDDFEHYDLEDLRRLDVTPGITGLWQVTARRDPSFQRNMALDLEYIERWNLWMDLRILCKTVPAVLRGSGA
jgi:exopolysaccharide biosynthesis polyprenyl glycosylphosphotransferase